MRTWLLFGTIAGFVITVVGLVLAWLGARREYVDAERRIETMERLSAAVRAESNTGDAERLAYWTDEYARHGIIRVTLGNLSFVAAYESRRLLGLVLNSTRRDFLVAAFGLLVSTTASVGSLYLS